MSAPTQAPAAPAPTSSEAEFYRYWSDMVAIYAAEAGSVGNIELLERFARDADRYARKAARLERVVRHPGGR